MLLFVLGQVKSELGRSDDAQTTINAAGEYHFGGGGRVQTPR